MVEIEIGVLLDRRITSIQQLTAEIAAWEQQRNAAAARINWRSQPKRLGAPIQNPSRVQAKESNLCAAVLATVDRASPGLFICFSERPHLAEQCADIESPTDRISWTATASLPPCIS
jgi:hypothetical protein